MRYSRSDDRVTNVQKSLYGWERKRELQTQVERKMYCPLMILFLYYVITRVMGIEVGDRLGELDAWPTRIYQDANIPL
jgi:hypothetical protein